MEKKYAEVLRSLELRALDQGIQPYEAAPDGRSVPTEDFLDYIASQYAYSAWYAGDVERKAEAQKQKFKSQRNLLGGLLAAVALYAGIVTVSSYAGSGPVPKSLPAQAQSSAASAPALTPQDFPETGVPLYSYCDPSERVAPLTIKTSGPDAHFIKLVSLDDPARYLTFFIRPGETAEYLAPLGNFELRYASGETWYGTNDLFGVQTAYAKSKDTFSFTYDGTYYNGYTVTLYPVSGGNMDTSPISPEDF